MRNEGDYFRTLNPVNVIDEVSRETIGVPVGHPKMQLGFFFGGRADEASLSICLSFEESVVPGT